MNTFYIRTFGCQMNDHDSERMAQLLNNLPCFWLELGQELTDIPRCVREMLREVCPR